MLAIINGCLSIILLNFLNIKNIIAKSKTNWIRNATKNIIHTTGPQATRKKVCITQDGKKLIIIEI